MELGTIFLNPDIKKLAPFEVTGIVSRIERKFDKTVYRIDEATTAASLTIYDLLRTLPGVSVEDGGVIIYKGVSPAIYVDNTPAQLLYPNLLAIPVDRVEKVELIDASMRRGGTGNGGIINIKLIKITNDGLSGVLSTKPATISFQNIDESSQLVNFNYKKKKNTFVSNTNLNTRNDQFDYRSISTSFNNPIISDSVITTSNISNNKSQFNFSECFGYIYQLNENTKFTYSISGSYSKDRSSSLTESIQRNESTNSIRNSIFNNSESKWSEPSGSIGINYWHQIDTNDQYIEANLFYALFGGKRISNSTQYIEYLNSEFIDSLSNIDAYSNNRNPQNLFLDFLYNKPLTKNTRFNIYYSIENQFHQKNQIRVFENNNLDILKNKDDNYLDINQIVSLRLGTEYKKWKWDAGINIEDQYIRGSYQRVDEFYQDSTRLIQKNYFKFLPSFVIGYLINDEEELKLSGSITSDYLNFYDLQDFIYKDNLKWYSGNSDLKPPKNYSLYFGYSFSKDNWNGAVDFFYSYSNNYNRPVVVQISEVITLNKQYNIAEVNKIGANFSFWFRIKKFSVSIYSKCYFQKYNINNLKVIALELNMPYTTPDEIHFNYNIYASLSYKIKKFTAQSNVLYFGKQYNELGSLNGHLNITFSVNYKFLKDKLHLGVGAKNLLRNLYKNISNRNSFGIISISESNGYAYQPSLYVSARYDLNFGGRNTENINGQK